MEHGCREDHWLQKVVLFICVCSALLIATSDVGKVYAAEWYEDYTYTTDSSTKTITLTKYNGTDVSELTVPGSATINGVTYEKIVINNVGNSSSLWSSDADSLTTLSIASGVMVKSGSRNLFSGLSKLQTLDIAGLDTSSITDMSNWFYDCNNLRYLDLSSLDVSNVSKANKTFYNCNKLAYLDISCFKTTRLYEVTQMFNYLGSNTNLQNLDLSELDFSIMHIDRQKMFSNAKITNLYLPADNSLRLVDFSGNGDNSGDISIPAVTCNICRIYYAGTQTQWNALGNVLGDQMLVCNYKKTDDVDQPQVDNPATDTWYSDYNYCLDKKNYRLLLLSYNKTGVSKLTVPAFTKIDGVIYTTFLVNENISTGSLWSKTGKKLSELTLEKGIVLSNDSRNLFKGLTALTKVNLNGVDMSNVLFMNNMFYGDYSITSIDLTNIDTSSVIDMTDMFINCGANTTNGIENLDVRSFDMSNADTSNILKGTVITNLYLPINAMVHYDFTGITNLSHIYYKGTKAKWDTLSNTVGSSVELTYEFTGSIPKKVTVSFNGNGGTVSPATKTVNVGETYGDLPTASRSNYTFDGWYTDASAGTEITSSSSVTETSAHTIYAHWSKTKAMVTLNANGGSVSPTSVEVFMGDYYSNLPTPTRSGYSFAGWYTAATGGTLVSSSTQVTDSSARTLYAHWKENVVKVTVSLNANGGTVSSGTLELVVGGTYGNLPTPTKSGYTFNGWYTAANNGTKIEANSTVTNANSHTLYAQWTEIITSVTVSLSPNMSGATVSPSSVVVAIGSTYGDLPTPAKADYKFEGWYTSSIGGTLVTSTTKMNSTSAHTLYAHWSLDSVTVYFEPGDGQITTVSKKVSIGEAYGELPVPALDNYSFDGWYTDSDGGDKITSDDIVTATTSHTHYARWVHNTVIVTFYSYAGGIVQSKEFLIGNNYGELPSPTTRTGYSFDGWYTSATEGNLITTDTIVEGESAFTLYAHWTKTTVTVKFNGDKASSVDPSSKSVTPGSQYGELPQPTADGYVFMGWYTSASNGTKVTSTTVVTEKNDHTLFAHWDKTITVSFNGNGNGQAVSNKTVTVNRTYGDLPSPTRSGYKFDGWYTTATGGEKITKDKVVTNENSHVLYAHWIKTTITVTLNGDKVSVAPETIEVTPGNAYGDELPQLSLNGYEFKGWYTEKLGGEKITSDSIVSQNEDHVLFARFVKLVTISFDGNGDGVSGIPVNRTIPVGQTYGSMTSPKRTGYDFEGWYTAATNGDVVTSNTLVTNNDSHVLYAHWIKNTVTVTFNGDKVTNVTPKSKEVTPGGKYSELPQLTFAGYEFKGWFTNATDGELVTADTTVSINNNHTLYARWKKEELKVTVSFDGNGDGVSNIANKTVTVGSEYGELSLPSREGYNFEGWYTEKIAGDKISADTIVSKESSHVLYAHWKKNTITVSFNGDRVESPSSIEVTTGSPYGTLPTLTLSGYDFEGWYTEATGGNKVTAETTVTEKQDHILFAHWVEKAKTVTVSFRGNGEGVTSIPDNKMVTVGQTYGDIDSPSRSGYSFEGWYNAPNDGDKIESTTKVTNTNSHVLYAHWKKNSITVTFNGDKYAPVDPESMPVVNGQPYGTLPLLTLDGYQFDGWYTEASGGEKVTANTIVSALSNHILFAHWTAITQPSEDEDVNVTVSFDGNGNGDSVSNKTMTVGQKYGALPVPVWNGYSFMGWYTESEGGQQVTADAYVKNKNSHVLYAHWNKNTVIVTFNGDKVLNVEPKSKTVTPGEEYGDLPELTLTGYEFIGWFTEAVGGVRIEDETTVSIAKDHTLFARWREKDKNVTISFDSNGINVLNKIVTVGQKYGNLPEPSRNGYTFIGWFTESESGEQITADTIVTNENSHVLYAHWKKNTVMVTFNGDKVSDMDTKNITVTSGGTYGPLPNLSLDGYTFKGWYTEAVGGDEITSTSTVTATNDHVLFAHWVEDNLKVTVSFDGNGDNVSGIPESVTLTVGDNYDNYAEPTRNGYSFDGWYTEEGKKIDSTVKVEYTYSHTLYAHWIKDEIIVTFNGDKVANVEPVNIKVSNGVAYGSLPSLSLRGYTFIGWFTDAVGGKEVSPTTIVTANNDHFLFAHWEEENKVTVSFSANGDGVSNMPENKTLMAGDKYGSLSTPIRSGYTFDGWYTKAVNGDKVTASTIVNKSHVLYAHWIKETITVSFNGGMVSTVNSATITVKKGDEYGNLPDLTLNGFEFKGWYTEAIGGDLITENTIVSENNDHILFAHWEEKELIITVSFDGNGNDVSNIPNNKTVTLGQKYGELATPVRDGYEFLGWYTEKEEGVPITADSYVKNEYSHSLYAHWKELEKKVIVIFNANRGVVDVTSMEVTVGGTYGALPEPTREKYNFDGWYTKPEGGVLITAESEVDNNEDHTLYAQWYEKDKTVRVTFNANGGEVDTGSITVNVGVAYGKLPVATKDGYIFDGWYTNADGGELITEETKVKKQMSHTLYAHWTDVNKKVILSFNANGGSLATEYKEVVVGQLYGRLPIPSREGYLWEGWFTSIEDGDLVTKDTKVEIDEAHTLYAHWINENDKITVSFNANGGIVDSESTDVVVGRAYGKLPVPVMEGYDFAGWYTEAEEGEPVSSDTIVSIAYAHTLFARWTVVSSGGQGDSDQPVTPSDNPNQQGAPNTQQTETDVPGTGTDTQITEPVAIPAVGTVVTEAASNVTYKVSSSDASVPTVIYKGSTDSKAAKAKTVTVPDTVTIDGTTYLVTEVGASAFKKNKNATKIVIGKNVKKVKKNTFKNCKKLKTLVFKTTKLTNKTLAKGAFKGITKKTVIKVPKSKLKAYKTLFRKKGLSKKVKIKKI